MTVGDVDFAGYMDISVSMSDGTSHPLNAEIGGTFRPNHSRIALATARGVEYIIHHPDWM